MRFKQLIGIGGTVAILIVGCSMPPSDSTTGAELLDSASPSPAADFADLAEIARLSMETPLPRHLKRIIESSPDTPFTPEGHTLLHLAAASGNASLTRLLLAHGANPNIRNELGQRPLHGAALRNDTTVAFLLRAAGALVNAADDLGMTPLHYAVWEDAVLMVRWLLRHGADPNAEAADQSPLHDAVRQNNPRIVRLLLQGGARPNLRNAYGETPLHLAAQHNHLELVRLLLQHGANPLAKDLRRKTPLDYARAHSHHQIVYEMLKIEQRR